MSLIKKADVKHYPSARPRTEIHLYRPEDEPGIADVVEEGSADAAPKIGDLANISINSRTPSSSEETSTVTASDPSPLAVSAHSKNAKS
jgi:hypothetical protein